VRRKNDRRLQRNRGRNEARQPSDAEEATGDRRQDVTLDKPRRNVSGVQQVIELEEKARAQQDDELPYRQCSRKPVEPRGDCAHKTGRDCLEISINSSPAYGPLVQPLFVCTRIPFFCKGTEHLMQLLSRCPDTNPGLPPRCVTHDLTIQAW
jgi:hypothetical protein